MKIIFFKTLLLIFLIFAGSTLKAQQTVVYTITGCESCHLALKLLNEQGIGYVQKNISENAGFREEMLQQVKSNVGIPQNIQMPVMIYNAQLYMGLQALYKIGGNPKNTLPCTLDEEPEDMKGITAAHNVFRAELGIPPLQWSNELAAYAKEWAQYLITKHKGDLVHRQEENKNPKGYGENLYQHSWSGSKPEEFKNSGVAAKSWGEEKAFFVNGKPMGQCCSGGVCGHYTQMIWQNTTHVGCAKAEAVIDGWNVEVYVCNYNPPGNYIGEKVYTGGGTVVKNNTVNNNTSTGNNTVVSNNNSGGSGDQEPDAFKGITAAHNVFRTELGIPPLKWSNEIAAYAQEWAEYLINSQKGQLVHRQSVNNNPKGYGENLYQHSWTGTKPNEFKDNGLAAKSWGSEKKYYVNGKPMGECCNGGTCGHYTQMIWQNSTEVGCGKASAVINGWNIEVVVCNYNPPGNYIGEPVYGTGVKTQEEKITDESSFTINFKNTKTTKISIAIAYPIDENTIICKGWVDVAPGQKITFPKITQYGVAFYCIKTADGKILGGGEEDDPELFLKPNANFEIKISATDTEVPQGYNLQVFKLVEMTSMEHTVNL